MYAPTILFTKTAILLLYRRVFIPHKKGVFDWIIRVFIVVLTFFYIADTFAKIWECVPRARIWNKQISGTCVNISTLLNTSGIFNMVTDVMILLVPVKAVWNLQMNKQRKIWTVLVFTVGLMYVHHQDVNLLSKVFIPLKLTNVCTGRQYSARSATLCEKGSAPTQT